MVAARPHHRRELALAVLQQPPGRLDPRQRRLDVRHDPPPIASFQNAARRRPQVEADQVDAGLLCYVEVRVPEGVGRPDERARIGRLEEDALQVARLLVQVEDAVAPFAGPEPEAPDHRVWMLLAGHLDPDLPGIHDRGLG
jgi:hypothetical protein